jgi:ATP-dependent exoDNAse (exonuclease V) beta subunit
LDALNGSIARARPLTGDGAGARIVVGAEQAAAFKLAAVATLDWLAEEGEFHDATVEVLQHVDNNTWLYTSYLSQMLATRDQWLPFVGSGRLNASDAALLRKKFEESLEFAVTEHLQRVTDSFNTDARETLADLCDYAATNMIQAGADASSIVRLAGLTELPPVIPASIPEWKGIAELLLTHQGQFRKQVDKRQGFPPDNKPKKEAMQGLLQSLAAIPEIADELHGVMSLPPVRYTDEQWQVLLALFRLLPLAVTELQRIFTEQGITDHIEIALAASRALGSPESPGDIALLLDYQIKHLLVDEMQDTSAAQYRMLETLTGGWSPGDGRTLCCVGDPMQSIYRFRNAEVGQFLLSRKFGIGNVQLEPLLLRRNFRSAELLVNWFNKVFPDVMAANDDPLRGAVSYSAAVPVPQWLGQGECVVHPVFGMAADDEAAAGSKLIADTLTQNPNDNMAVLVRGRSQLPQLLARLRKIGIAYRAVDIDRLTDLPEIIDVLAITRAAAHQGDRIAWLGLLRSPWIGLQWCDLHALVRNDKSSTVWELLQDEDRLASLSDYGQRAIRDVFDILARLTKPRPAQSLRDLVEKTWLALGGPGILSDRYAVENVYRYFEVLARIEHAGTLVDVGELEETLDLELVSSNDPSRLQIMTMHRAKGLQFDHVLLYGLGRQPGHGDRRVLSWFDLPAQHGAEQKVISPVGPRAEVSNDPLHRYIELTESVKDKHEHARLLYVACTRARKTLHIMGNTAIATDGESINPARSDSLLHLLWPAVEEEFSRQFGAGDGSRSKDSASIWATPELRRFSAKWTLPDAELLQEEAMPEDVREPNDEVDFYWVGTDARIAGTLVHRWLLLLANRRASSADLATRLRSVTTRWLKEAGIVGDAALPVVDRVEAAVTGTLAHEKGRWILAGEGHAELALTGLAEGEIVSVILDRVRVGEDGTHWIIDYKTSSHEGGNLQGFLKAETDRYQAQLTRYADIYKEWSGQKVKCALYFPLLKSFVEVAV